MDAWLALKLIHAAWAMGQPSRGIAPAAKATNPALTSAATHHLVHPAPLRTLRAKPAFVAVAASSFYFRALPFLPGGVLPPFGLIWTCSNTLVLIGTRAAMDPEFVAFSKAREACCVWGTSVQKLITAPWHVWDRSVRIWSLPKPLKALVAFKAILCKT